MKNFEPVIVAFCCNYCAYTAADMAGSMKLSYPSNVKIVRVPCAGRVDVKHILTAFENGADGVYVAGCLDGDCHFKNGNIKASRRVEYVKGLLKEIGIKEQRLKMVKMSAGMGVRFARTATDITDEIRKLGPNFKTSQKTPAP